MAVLSTDVHQKYKKHLYYSPIVQTHNRPDGKTPANSRINWVKIDKFMQ